MIRTDPRPAVLDKRFPCAMQAVDGKVRGHGALVDLLQMAYSAEKAAAFANQGHAGSVKSAHEKMAIKQIEEDEWGHRHEVLLIMLQYGIPVSRWCELRFHVTGKVISGACYFIGWFMQYYFAGRSESGNVCEYFRLMHYFHELGITEHDQALFDMGVREKEHEVYFLERIKNRKALALFERIFNWGAQELERDGLGGDENKLPLQAMTERASAASHFRP